MEVRNDLEVKELNRANNNAKIKKFIDDMLKECEAKEFTIADMKDLAALIPSKISKAIISNDENTVFKI